MYNRLYLITFTSIEIEELTKLFDESPNVGFWFYHMRLAIFVRSTLTSAQLQNLIQSKFGMAPYLFIIEVRKGDNYAGWIPDNHIQYF
jgi:hypothetical protein